MKHKVIIFCLLLSIFFGIASPVQAEEVVPRFEPGECPIRVPSDPEITCGYLVAPEDYQNPEGRTVRLPVIIIHNRAGDPNADAVLFSEGGPGYSSLNSVWGFASAPFVQNHDFVIMEQRGNVYAEPSLICDISVLWEETTENTACLDSLIDEGIDLSLYNTENIAADMDTLRQVLDYPAWNLFGSSYSTRPMQLVLAQDPDDIRSVVFNSAVPMTSTRYQHDPEHSARAIQQMLDDCAADQACAAAYPDLENQLYGLIAELNANPVPFDLTFPGTDVQFEDRVDGNDLIGWMVGDAFYQPAFHPFATAYLPLLISELSAGRMELLWPWVMEDLAWVVNDQWAWGLYFTVNCQDFAPTLSRDEFFQQIDDYPQLGGYIRHGGEFEICEAWDLPASNGLLSEPVSTDIPTLVLAGSYDPITPPEWSMTALENFSNLTFVEFPSAGHSVPSVGSCPYQLVTDFLENPTAQLDLSCMNDTRPVQFVLPEEIIIAPAMYEVHWNELGASMLEENLFLGSFYGQLVCALIILISVVVNLIRRKRFYQRGKVAKVVQPLAVGLAVFCLLWGFWLRFLLQDVASNGPIILHFGMPAITWPLFVLAILIGIASITLAVLMVLTWKRGYWSLFRRILLSLSALAALVFSGMLGYWGFFTALFSLL